MKHFSVNEDGKNIYVINLRDKHQNKIYTRNKGDSCFWVENFYDSIQFNNRKTLELAFNRLVESKYDKIISEIIKEKPIEDHQIKDELLLLIFFSLFRSPGRRDEYDQALRLQNWINEVSTNGEAEKIEKNFDKDLFIKELHLSEFASNEIFYKNIESICTNLGIKKWTIIIAPENSYWITSDDPCVEIKYNEDGTVRASKQWNFEELEAMFIPLTKKYCLLIESYSQDDDINLNLNTDKISFKKAENRDVLFFNRLSYVTMSKILISPTENVFRELAYELERITTINNIHDNHGGQSPPRHMY